jgi:hypothetical protein
MDNDSNSLSEPGRRHFTLVRTASSHLPWGQGTGRVHAYLDLSSSVFIWKCDEGKLGAQASTVHQVRTSILTRDGGSPEPCAALKPAVVGSVVTTLRLLPSTALPPASFTMCAVGDTGADGADELCSGSAPTCKHTHSRWSSTDMCGGHSE